MYHTFTASYREDRIYDEAQHFGSITDFNW